MKRPILILFLCALTLCGYAKTEGAKAFATLLTKQLSEEDIHPDSLYAHLRLLEKQKAQCTDPTMRAVMAATLGKLYALRVWRAQSYQYAEAANPDSMQEWAQMDYYRASVRNFGEALQSAELLYHAKAEDWTPLAQTDRNAHQRQMLGVTWQALTESLGREMRQQFSLPSYEWLVQFYKSHYDRSSALFVMLDSLQSTPLMPRFYGSQPQSDEYRQALEKLCTEYADVPACAEVYLLLSQSNGIKPELRREYLNQGLQRYPKYKRRSALLNALTDLQAPSLEWSGKQTVYPKRTYDWAFNVRNITAVTWSLYRLPKETEETPSAKEVQKQGTLIQSEEHTFAPSDPILTQPDTLRWQAPAESGQYALVLMPIVKVKTSERPEPLIVTLKVTRRKTLTLRLPDGSIRCEAVNAVSGAPLGCDCEPEDLPHSRNYWTTRRDTTTRMELRLFTDRAIYRPGQKVHVAGMAYSIKEWDYAALPNKSYTLKLLNTKRETISTTEVKTDQFGMFGIEVQLPADEVGYCQLVCDNARSSIRVEEYKRPTFEVCFDETPATHYPVDTIVLTGYAKHYNGTPVQSARLTGHYEWSPSRWCPVRSTVSNTLDTLQTDGQGRFVLRIPVSRNVEDYRYGMWLRTTVYVVDANGEMHEAATNLSLCSHAIRLHGSMSRLVNRSEPQPLTLTAYSSSEKEMDAQVRLTLSSKDKTLLDTLVSTALPVEIPQLKRLQPGRYNAHATTIYEGDTAHWSYEFLLCDIHSNTLPVDTALWCYCPTSTFAHGDTVRLQVGTSLPQGYIYLTAAANDCIIKDTILCMTGAAIWEFPYEERFGQALTIAMALVHEEEMYARSQIFYLRKPQKELCYEWHTFRDHLTPGSKEEWTLRLTHKDGTPAKASLLATMYDASLDALVRHNLAFRPYYSNYTNHLNWSASRAFDFHESLSLSLPQRKTYDLSVSRFNEKYFQVNTYEATTYSMVENTSVKRRAAAPMLMMSKATAGAALQADTVEDASEEVVQEETEEDSTADDVVANVSLRQNFNETAFFLPSLVTDEDGYLTLRFTLPESLTSWHFMGMAHTEDMHVAHIEQHAVATKPLMGEISLPRFVRQSDYVSLTASVQNLSHTIQHGTALLTITDAATERIILRERKKFNVDTTARQTFQFSFPVPASSGALLCRWQVQGDGCSDGEQRLLPVLTDKEWVDCSQVLWLDKKGKHNIDLSALQNAKGDSMRVTVEYTAHPIWCAIQALPTMATPKQHDALSLATAYYAIAMSRHLTKQLPSLVSDTLLANAALQEKHLAQWLSKLRQMQQPDGSFSWYPGMPASTYITAEVAVLLARLQALTKASDATSILNDCVNFLSKESDHDVSPLALQLLYVKTLIGSPLNRTQREWLRSLSTAVLQWGLESQSLAAIVLAKQGEKGRARDVFEHVQHYLVSSPDKGRYFDYPEGAMYSIDMKLRRHTLAMEAMRCVVPSADQPLSEMRRWLLQQKRVQGWDTPLQCVDAVYALTVDASDLLADHSSDQLTLRAASRLMPLTSGNDPKGYVRRTYDIRQIPTSLSIEKTSNGESWGAVYLQSLQPLDSVRQSQGDLRVETRYIMPKGNALHGICTIQYIVTARRDFDFVTLSAQHAACLEQTQPMSGIQWQDGLSIYRTVRDRQTDFAIQHLPRGTYVIQQRMQIERPGSYAGGLVSIRCQYAKEFCGHDASQVLRINE